MQRHNTTQAGIAAPTASVIGDLRDNLGKASDGSQLILLVGYNTVVSGVVQMRTAMALEMGVGKQFNA
jgi:hypothetical protein